MGHWHSGALTGLPPPLGGGVPPLGGIKVKDKNHTFREILGGSKTPLNGRSSARLKIVKNDDFGGAKRKVGNCAKGGGGGGGLK